MSTVSAHHGKPEAGRGVYHYRHSQNARWTFWGILLIGLATAGFVGYSMPDPVTGLALGLLTLALVALILLVLFRLTVTLDDEAIRLSFGIGIIRKAIPLESVISCKTVRNRAWWGWGIKMFFDGISPAGWLYNVDGLNAVELEMKNGSRLRIGTDEPDELQAAILRCLDQA